MVYCYDDVQSGWGKQLRALAAGRKMPTRLLRNHEDLPLDLREEALFFCRVEQFPPLHEASKKFCLDVLNEPTVRGVQNFQDVHYYERKDLQAQDSTFREFMPETWVLTDSIQVESVLGRLGLPLVSKAAFGSSSSNVRVLRTRKECLDEAYACLESAGMHTPKRGTQQGYLIWQKFLPSNQYVYRVNRIGTQYQWILRVYNRANDCRASGSGVYEPVTQLNNETALAMYTAKEFFDRVGTKWCGIDLAYDFDAREWQVLETTLAWNMRAPGANRACPMMLPSGVLHPKGYKGAEQFELVLDEIQAGQL